MKYLLRAALVGALLIPAFQVAAQSLTKAQAGRVAVAQCYTKCVEAPYLQSRQGARLALDSNDGEWSLENTALVLCTLSQGDAIAGDMCLAGCRDIEAAYGYRSSHIRTRFHRWFNEFLRDVKTAGLWTAWNRYPRGGSRSFVNACARYIQILGSRSASVAEQMKDVKPLSEEELHAKREEVIANEHYPEPPPVWEGLD